MRFVMLYVYILVCSEEVEEMLKLVYEHLIDLLLLFKAFAGTAVKFTQYAYHLGIGPVEVLRRHGISFMYK
jgi:hypothetical protein